MLIEFRDIPKWYQLKMMKLLTNSYEHNELGIFEVANEEISL